MKPVEEHLMDYCRTIIRDLGKVDGRRCLRGCIPIWRDAYGKTVTNRVIIEIQKILGEQSK